MLSDSKLHRLSHDGDGAAIDQYNGLQRIAIMEAVKHGASLDELLSEEVRFIEGGVAGTLKVAPRDRRVDLEKQLFEKLSPKDRLAVMVAGDSYTV